MHVYVSTYLPYVLSIHSSVLSSKVIWLIKSNARIGVSSSYKSVSQSVSESMIKHTKYHY